HFVHDSEPETLQAIRTLVGYLPSNNLDDAPRRASDDPVDRREERLLTILPDAASTPYDMHDVVRAVIDHGDFFEVMRAFAPNILTGFARLGGRSAGIIANQPAVLAGVLDINASV